MTPVLLLTGTCGSGKSTVSTLLQVAHGWIRISEDDIWHSLYGKNRGPFGSIEHRSKRQRVHEVVFSAVLDALQSKMRAVIDATVHESPPEAFDEYRQFFEQHGIEWMLVILHPRLEVAIARDAQRPGWIAGPQRVKELRAKFTGRVFAPHWFVDNSDQSPEQTVLHILNAGAA